MSLSEQLLEILEGYLKGSKPSIERLVEVVEKGYYALLDLKLIREAPWIIKEQFKMIDEISEILSKEYSCPQEFLARTQKFYKLLLAGRIAYSKSRDCVLIKVSSKPLVIGCTKPLEALLRMALGEVEPIVIE